MLGPSALAEIIECGSYFHNPANTESQDAYWLTNLRAGVHTTHWFVEVWVKNAFDTEFVPAAFGYPDGQSGFLGESGAPLTVGLRTGYTYLWLSTFLLSMLLLILFDISIANLLYSIH